MSRLSLLTAIVSLFVACESPSDFPAVVTALTSPTPLRLGESITITLTNHTGLPIFVPLCCNSFVYHLDRLELSGKWVPYGSSDIPCTKECGKTPPQPVLPSQSRSDSILYYPIDKDGTYRLRIPYFDEEGSPRMVSTNSILLEMI